MFPSRKQRLLFVLAALLAGAGLQVPSAAHAANLAPQVAPSVREWTGGTGVYTLTATSRILVDPAHTAQLSTAATALRVDLGAISGVDVPVISSSAPATGDILLTLTTTDAGIGDQGYLLTAGPNVVVRGNAAAGVYYGTQTLLQMIKQSATATTVPAGTIRDFPQYRERGLMLDVGRHFYEMDYLENLLRRMAWLRLNTLRMHFTEWNGFRLRSDRYPGLASAQSYSKADLRRMQDVAKRYHITIVPEIDLPGHATTMTTYDPTTRFTCPSMDYAPWPGGSNGGWTLNLTKDSARTFAMNLLSEFVPLFDGPYFHIGGDEYQNDAAKNSCPELVSYAQARGFPYTGDVFTEFMNLMNDKVRSYGKTAQLWNWWETNGQQTSIKPSTSIVLTPYTGSLNYFYNLGYTVVGVPESTLYVTPGLNLYVNAKNVYESWTPDTNAKVNGYKIARWSDAVEHQTDEWFDQYAKRPTEVLAERLWGGPRSSTVEAFFTRVDAIGDAPGVPSVVQVNDNTTGTGDNQFSYSGTWQYGTNGARQFQGDDHYSSTLDSAYQVRFTGNKVKLFAARAANHGRAGVSIDGGPETVVDLYSPTRVDQAMVFTSGLLAQGSHVLRVRVLNSRNASSSGTAVTADKVEVSRAATPAAAFDPSTEYRVVNRNSAKVLEVPVGSGDGGGAIQWSSNGAAHQRWTLVEAGGGYHRIVNRSSGKVLDVSGASTADGASVVQWTSHGGANQLWSVIPAGTHYKIINRNSGKALTVANAATNDGAAVVQSTYRGGTEQQWTITR
ncbi:family 20 glycosylhydrolase [Micromonospora zamorensis]|uniref:beta-N-acetylhexosaminidase n=1 Tax=Micromonospora zamorensis TaxID=709883 RepID=A0ABZ1P7D6_9ACTN